MPDLFYKYIRILKVVKFLPLTLTLSRRGRGDSLNFPSLDGRGERGG
jgi:hypothetical protein